MANDQNVSGKNFRFYFSVLQIMCACDHEHILLLLLLLLLGAEVAQSV
jgi:hypothetical protein